MIGTEEADEAAVVGAAELQSLGSSAKQSWLLIDLCIPLASVPALPHLQTLQVLEHLSCRTVFFPQDWRSVSLHNFCLVSCLNHTTLTMRW